MAVKVETAIAKIEKRGILLVFPITNRAEPRSLWSELHPRVTMRWEWDESGDGRVVELWRIRERLARSGDVVYAKWFRGRATLFALPVFRGMLSMLQIAGDLTFGLSPQAKKLLDILEDDSPQSTKALRGNADLQGRANEAIYTRALKELWSRLLIVGAGEVDDGAFPSLAIGATRLLFEDLWLESATPRASDLARVEAVFAEAPLFARELEKARASITGVRRDRAK